MDVDETTENAYEIVMTCKTTGANSSLTTNTPQGAIALADNVRDNLNAL